MNEKEGNIGFEPINIAASQSDFNQLFQKKEEKFSLETVLVPHAAGGCGAAGINGIR